MRPPCPRRVHQHPALARSHACSHKGEVQGRACCQHAGVAQGRHASRRGCGLCCPLGLGRGGPCCAVLLSLAHAALQAGRRSTRGRRPGRCTACVHKHPGMRAQLLQAAQALATHQVLLVLEHAVVLLPQQGIQAFAQRPGHWGGEPHGRAHHPAEAGADGLHSWGVCTEHTGCNGQGVRGAGCWEGMSPAWPRPRQQRVRCYACCVTGGSPLVGARMWDVTYQTMAHADTLGQQVAHDLEGGAECPGA